MTSGLGFSKGWVRCLGLGLGFSEIGLKEGDSEAAGVRVRVSGLDAQRRLRRQRPSQR